VTESKSRPKPNPPLDSRRHRKSAVAVTRSTRKLKSDTHRLKTLTGADQAFLFFRGHEPSAEINNYGKKYKIAFSTSVLESHSSTEGIQLGQRIQSGLRHLGQLFPN